MSGGGPGRGRPGGNGKGRGQQIERGRGQQTERGRGQGHVIGRGKGRGQETGAVIHVLLIVGVLGLMIVDEETDHVLASDRIDDNFILICQKNTLLKLSHKVSKE